MKAFGFSARQLRATRMVRTPVTVPAAVRFNSTAPPSYDPTDDPSAPVNPNIPTSLLPGGNKALEKQERQHLIEPELDNFGRPKIKAAAPINLEQIRYVRIIPASPGYFSRHPFFAEGLVELHQLLNSYRHLPQTSAPEVQTQWRTLEDYISVTREPIRAVEYKQAIDMCEQLMRIHPAIMPKEVRLVLGKWKADVTESVEYQRPRKIDQLGRSLGIGKRKACTARAWLIEGNGEVIINGKPIIEAFGRIHDRESALWALHTTQRMDKYNVFAIVQGGGTTGQAEALALAVSRALLGHEPALKPILRKAGCVTQDSRTVERKKHGHVKARKMPAWVKR